MWSPHLPRASLVPVPTGLRPCEREVRRSAGPVVLATLLPLPALASRRGRRLLGAAAFRSSRSAAVLPGGRTAPIGRTIGSGLGGAVAVWHGTGRRLLAPRLSSWAVAAEPDAGGGSAAPGPVLQRLRQRLEELGVDALLVPTDDPHLSEIPPACFARRAFLSGFDGSAGTAVVTAAEALLWTDGRYFLQAERQLSEDWQLMKSGVSGTPTVSEWLASSLKNGQVVGLDPAVHPASFVAELRSKLGGGGCDVRCLEENPVDEAWGAARPPLPCAPVRQHPEHLAGLAASEKLACVRKVMAEEGAGALVVSALDEVAYLLNIRGGDVARTPVVLAYLVVEDVAAVIFVNAAKLSEEVVHALEVAGVAIKPYEDAFAAVKALAAGSAEGSKRIWLDPKQTNFALHEAASEGGAQLVPKPSPVAAMKARKHPAELEGMRAAHRRDAAALALALVRLEGRVRGGGEPVTEVDVDTEVTGQRAAQWGYLDNSFDTIAGYGPNGAVIHYRAEPATAATLGTSSLFLLDSGAQYIDGTTDVTRTMHFGAPTQHERDCFTRVLKGHIALATAVFPEGTPGFVVDAFARRPLWAAGLDYRHGTGHGVGAALAVHEGPQGIAQRYDNKTPLEPGMIVSNEPGYYSDGEFGIRIENLLVVVEKETEHRFGGKKYLGFEPLTLVPIQQELIDVRLLDLDELHYLDAYHARIRKEIEPLLTGPGLEDARDWLLRSTRPLAGAAAASASAPTTVGVAAEDSSTVSRL